MDFLYLCEEDMIKVGVKDMPRCIDVMEDTFRLLYIGDYRLGGPNNSDHGLRTRFPKESNIPNMPLDAPGRWFTAMPAYLGGQYHCFGFKTYGANQDNTLHDIPRSILMMQLLDAETGAPISFMSANILSAMRTGAISGLFARYFADKNAKKVAVIGPGVIGRYSLDAVMSECPNITEISVFGRGEKSKEAFKQHCLDKGYNFVVYKECESIKDACESADIVITATTQASRFVDYPLIDEGYLKNGACVIVTSAIRIDRSYTDSKDTNCIFVADDKRMYMENRGIDAQPANDEERKSVTVKGALSEWLLEDKCVYNLPEIVSEKSFSRNNNAIYICASGGIPIEDVSWAYVCYKNALERKIGIRLNIWEKSQL